MSALRADSWSKLAQTIGSGESITLRIGQSANPHCNDFHLNRRNNASVGNKNRNVKLHVQGPTARQRCAEPRTEIAIAGF